MTDDKKTLWEITKAWWKRNFGTPDPPPLVPEEQVFNPYNAKIGKTTLTVDTLELRDKTFMVDTITEYKLNYGKKNFSFVDYSCKSVLHQGEQQSVVVRVYPSETKGIAHQVLVLSKWDELDYDEDFKKMLSDEQFNTMLDGEIEASFWRINDVKTPYEAKTTHLSKNGDAVDTDAGENWYWDYWRETKDEGNTEFKEFLFVNWDKSDTGRFTISRGEEVGPSRISVL